MRRCELDALLLALPVSVRYATEHESSFETVFRDHMLSVEGRMGRPFRSFAVISARGERALVTHAAIAVTSYRGWEGALEVYGGAGFDDAVVEAVPAEMRSLARRLASATAERTAIEAAAAAISTVVPHARRVGVELDGLEPGELDLLARAFGPAPPELPDASVLVRLIRMVKSGDQVARLTHAAEVAEVGLDALVDAAAPGVDATTLADRLRAIVGEHGADFEHFAIDPRGFGIAMGSHVFEDQDVTMLDIGCRFRGCVSDSGVTLALAAPSAEVEEEYAALIASIESGADRLRPGERVADIHHAMRAAVEGTAGAASRPQGHGLGQEPKELPLIDAVEAARLRDECIDVEANLPLEEGMVINLEIPLEVPGSRSFQIEKTFVITADGARPIIPQDRARVALVPTASMRTIRP